MNAVIVACIALVLAAVGVSLRWGHLRVEPPWAGDDDDRVPAAVMAKRMVWYLDVLVIGGVGAGLLAVGPGGRLVMRLLAATAGDDAQGRVTEADEIVGVITVGGTIGFVLFVGMFGGLLLAALYGALRKWLPAGRAGALVAGLVFAVTMATRLDPLRPENEDFRIVGPGWLSVLSFLALGALSVLTLAALAARVARSLPVIEKRPGAVLPYAPLLLLVPTSLGVPLLVIVGGVAIALLSKPAWRRAWSDRRVLLAGRVVIAVGVLALLPAFVADMVEIL